MTSSPTAASGRPTLLPERFLFGACLLLFALTLLLIRADFDTSLLLAIYQGARAESLWFWTAISYVGSTPAMVFVVMIFAIVLSGRRRYITALWLASGWGLTSSLVQTIKWLTGRARPSVPPLITAQEGSFPSGHSAESLFVFYFLWILLAGSGLLRSRGWLGAGVREFCSVLLAILPPLIGYSRVYLGVHWPSDVLAGWAIGFFVLGIAVLSASGTAASIRSAPVATEPLSRSIQK